MAVLLVAFSYWATGVVGAVVQAAFIALLVGVEAFGPVVRAFLGDEGAEAGRKDRDNRRTTYVRIQRPRILVVGLQIGGRMRGIGWKDVTAERYDTYPKAALRQAVDDYMGYRVSHYVEQHPDVEMEEPLEEIHENAWITVNPERDLPDE